jgi:hypothetical protein
MCCKIYACVQNKVIPNFVVYIYGQREFGRRYEHKCHHHEGLLAWAFKAAICKPIIGGSVSITLIGAMIGLVMGQAVHTLFTALEYICDSSEVTLDLGLTSLPDTSYIETPASKMCIPPHPSTHHTLIQSAVEDMLKLLNSNVVFDDIDDDLSSAQGTIDDICGGVRKFYFLLIF